MVARFSMLLSFIITCLPRVGKAANRAAFCEDLTEEDKKPSPLGEGGPLAVEEDKRKERINIVSLPISRLSIYFKLHYIAKNVGAIQTIARL